MDTVVAAMVDMQGRLVGKRFQAEFFVDSAVEETHACNYLLADDIDMEPVPGYEARVIDAEGREVPRGTPGRLAVRGPRAAAPGRRGARVGNGSDRGPGTPT